MARKGLLLIAALLIVATGSIAAWTIYSLSQGRSAGGTIITDSAITIGGPFSLTDHTGTPVTEQDFAGRPHLVFFGFTHCPDICPTKLAEASLLLEQLGGKADEVDVLFISVDPERDTPEILADYISNFHPQVRGLTGTPEEIASVAKAFRVYYKKVELDGGDYTMDHTAVVYLFDRQGRFVAPVALDRPVEDVAAQVRAVI